VTTVTLSWDSNRTNAAEQASLLARTLTVYPLRH